ncbi:MAG: sigma-70 family RNA polymerase sigma factor [Leptospirales bacterium]|nr:sigma-70 family RNA polymerase sigma factor [Leptospirales bacterium]
MRVRYDEQTLNAARSGSREALERLLFQCQPDVRHFARKVCATPEDVEDAVQETLWIVSRKLGSLRVATAFASWAFRVVKHECYRLLRRNRNETNAPSLEEVSYVDSSVDTQAVLRAETLEALMTLPELFREVVVMRDVEGIPAAEVASVLGLTLPAVKSRLHRGRHLMRLQLEHWMQ